MEGAITAGEAAAVCAHYDLGVVREVRPLDRGSARSGKAILKSESGVFLLKRRAAAQGDPRRVALSHQVQLHLQAVGYPTPPLVGTRGQNNSMVQIGSRVYEVFRFVPGTAYDGSARATAAAGRALAWYHRALLGFIPGWDPPTVAYHDLGRLPSKLMSAAGRMGCSPGERAGVRSLVTSYETAAAAARRLGVNAMPRQMLHGDWHPGNLLFTADGGVAAVVDHDSVGMGQRVLDLAYGSLHFAMPRIRFRTPPEGTFTAAAALDEARLSAFVGGYHQESGGLTRGEAAALPWLMAEAFVAEAGVVWAALRTQTDAGEDGTGGAAGAEGRAGAFLAMAAGKAQWLVENAGRLGAL